MKQKNYTLSPSDDLSSWLKQFDSGDVVTKMADLCDSTAVFIIDQQHQLILWSRGAEKLLGRKQSEMLGRPCAKKYDINESELMAERELTIYRPDGVAIEVKQHIQTLFKKGQFLGAISLLFPGSVPVPRSIPDDITMSKTSNDFHGILSRSPAMQPVFQIIENAAKTEATVLVRGESGSGKELVARAIHDLSSRHKAPFLAINCAALSVNLLESELFGHVRGAFSGAIKDHAGLFQRAHGGTLFLDEVAELPQELQAKLLRVLQERNYIPVGGSQNHDVDVRIVAATHRSLREEVRNGRFREDLMYRLRVVPIFIPPLRERREDINLLLWHFINQHNTEGYRKVEKIDPQAMRVLLDYNWPGNIRELQNVLEYAFVVGRGTTLRSSELPPEFREQNYPAIQSQTNFTLSVDDEITAIRQALEQCNGKVGQAADLIGMSRATFWRKRKQYKL